MLPIARLQPEDAHARSTANVASVFQQRVGDPAAAVGRDQTARSANCLRSTSTPAMPVELVGHRRPDQIGRGPAPAAPPSSRSLLGGRSPTRRALCGQGVDQIPYVGVGGPDRDDLDRVRRRPDEVDFISGRRLPEAEPPEPLAPEPLRPPLSIGGRRDWSRRPAPSAQPLTRRRQLLRRVRSPRPNESNGGRRRAIHRRGRSEHRRGRAVPSFLWARPGSGKLWPVGGPVRVRRSSHPGRSRQNRGGRDVAQLLIPHSARRATRLRPGAVVEIASPAPRDIWRGVLRDDPGATALQTPEYLDAVVTATGGTDVSRFYQLRDGRQLVLPLVRRRSRLGLHLDRGYPDGYGHGGMLATGGLLADDVRAVVRDLRGQSLSLWTGGAHHTSEQWSAGLLPGVTDASTRGRRDRAGLRAMSTTWRPSARTGSPTRPGSSGSARFGPVSRWRRTPPGGWSRSSLRSTGRGPRAGSPARGCRPWSPAAWRWARSRTPKFAAVAAMAGDACRLFVAWYHGRPVAATAMLVHDQHAVAWRSYSIAELATPVSAQPTHPGHRHRGRCPLRLPLHRPGPVRRGGHLQREENSLGAVPRSVVDLRIEPAGLARLRAVRDWAEGVLARALARSPGRSTLGQPSLSRLTFLGPRPDGRPASRASSIRFPIRPGCSAVCIFVGRCRHEDSELGPAPIAQ